jgi:hypothetical protein
VTNIFYYFIFIFFVAMFSILLIKWNMIKIENTKLKSQMIDVMQQNQIFKTLLDQKDSANVEKTEAFLNFVTQSRDWAFEYIEDVQRVINSVLKQTESTVKYHNEFSSLVIEPYKKQLDTLVNAIEELKFLLPNEEFFK